VKSKPVFALDIVAEDIKATTSHYAT